MIKTPEMTETSKVIGAIGIWNRYKSKLLVSKNTATRLFKKWIDMDMRILSVFK